jgi:hypothetical protein
MTGFGVFGYSAGFIFLSTIGLGYLEWSLFRNEPGIIFFDHAFRSSKTMYTLGTIMSVKMVELVSPPITVIESGLQRLDPSCVLIAIGRRPRSVAMVVISIGLKRSLDARTTAFV